MNSTYFLEIASIHKKIQKFDSELDEMQESALNLLKATMKNLERQLQEMQMKQELDKQFEEHISVHKQKLKHIEKNECMEFLSQLSMARSKIKYAFEVTTGGAIQEDFHFKSNQFHDLVMEFKGVISTCKTKGFF